MKILNLMDERQEERFGEQPDESHLRRKFRSGPGRLWAGLFLLLVGGVLLLDQMGFPLPDWLFSWHILLVAIGLFLGLRHNFRGGAWLILILVGGCFIIQDFYPKTELKRFIGPCVLIFIGILIMFRPRRQWRNNPWKEEWKENLREKWRQHEFQKHHRHWRPPGTVGGPNQFGGPAGTGGPNQFGGPNSFNNPNTGPTSPNPNAPGAGPADPQTATGPSDPNQGANSQQNANGQQNAHGPQGQQGPFYSEADYIDSTSIFSGVHKKIVSKNFRGGDIVTFLGGSEIDLSQAEIIGTARLDVTQVMGGTKIIVPAHWEVRSEVTALFAGFEDKRQQPAIVNPEKVLIIDGTSIFGGIELKNY
jgi:predicted membrane protein